MANDLCQLLCSFKKFLVWCVVGPVYRGFRVLGSTTSNLCFSDHRFVVYPRAPVPWCLSAVIIVVQAPGEGIYLSAMLDYGVVCVSVGGIALL